MFEEVGEGVFRRRYESLDFNVGVVLGLDGVLIVDTRASHSEGDEIRADLDRLTNLPVKWIVNTHWHWDHVFGNSRFPHAEIWGHDRCREVLATRGAEMKRGAKLWMDTEFHSGIDEVEIAPPTRTFSSRITIDVGREVSLAYFGLAHTDADITVTVDDAGVVFMGDMIEEGAPPNFGDSYPVSWPLSLLEALDDGPDTLVPGHGDVVDRVHALSQHQELVAVAELATACMKGHAMVDDASRSGPYPVGVMRSALERAVSVANHLSP
jgi:glyoxylase-like metal-dependent hydrolase (beta-lactamase superfamily II)